MEEKTNSVVIQLIGYRFRPLFKIEWWIRNKLIKYNNKYKYYTSKPVYTQEYDAIVSSTPLPYELCDMISQYSNNVISDFVKRVEVALESKLNTYKEFLFGNIFCLEHNIDTKEKFEHFINLLDDTDLSTIKYSDIFLACSIPEKIGKYCLSYDVIKFRKFLLYDYEYFFVARTSFTNTDINFLEI